MSRLNFPDTLGLGEQRRRQRPRLEKTPLIGMIQNINRFESGRIGPLGHLANTAPSQPLGFDVLERLLPALLLFVRQRPPQPRPLELPEFGRHLVWRGTA